MQPHSIRVKLCDQPLDAFDLRWVSRRTQQLEVALNPFVYFYARLAHICAMPTDGFGFGFMLVLIRGTFPHGLQPPQDGRSAPHGRGEGSGQHPPLRRRFRLKSAFLIQESERRFRPTIVFESSLGAAVSSLARRTRARCYTKPTQRASGPKSEQTGPGWSG